MYSELPFRACAADHLFFGWRCISLLRSICIYPFTALMLMIKESKQANLKKRLLVQLNIWQQLVCVMLFGKKHQ